MSRTLIKNVTIIDGTGNPGYEGCVVIKEDRIHQILQENPEVHEVFDHIIDGKGRVLTPGFIDSHSHSDLMLFKQAFLKPKIRQGITTEILGQDGISVAPLPMEHVMSWRQNLAGLDGAHESFNWNFVDVKDYLTCIDNASITSNFSYLMPHGNVRMSVMGFEDREATALELIMMKEKVKEAMEVGCPGLSAGLIYTPGAYGNEEELTELCKVVSAYDGVFVVHQRSEAAGILASLDELIRIALNSGVRLHISHFKLCGKKNWSLMSKVLEKVDEARQKGIELTFDIYPYTAGSTMLSAIIPPWGHVGGTEALIKRLKHPEARKRLMADMMDSGGEWDNFIEFAGTEGIYITDVGSEENRWAVGKNLDELGEIMALSPLDAAFDLLIQEANHVSMVDFYGSEDHIKTLVSRPEATVCTDGLLGGKAHPRVYSAFPKVIKDYVTDLPVMSLEEAIHKMTMKPAGIFGLKDRGRIREGYYADLVIFDPVRFAPTNTYEAPHDYPDGLSLVMVNGQPVYDQEAWHLSNCGRLLLRDTKAL